MTNATTNATVTPLITNPELFTLIKSSDLGRGASDDDIRLFLYTANRLGLDPLARQIYMRMADNGRMQTLLTIDGYRSVADRTGECDGQDAPLWCGEDGIWRDVWLQEEPPLACKVTVYRRGQTRGYTGIATYMSYVVYGSDGEPTHTWTKLPDTMLAKCAEAIALRKAFPSQLSGMYLAEEMEQASSRGRTSDQARASAPKTADQEHTLELNDEGLTRLFGRINDAKTEGDLRSCLPMIRRLGTKQKNAVRTAWRSKATSEGWIKDKNPTQPNQQPAGDS